MPGLPFWRQESSDWDSTGKSDNIGRWTASELGDERGSHCGNGGATCRLECSQHSPSWKALGVAEGGGCKDTGPVRDGEVVSMQQALDADCDKGQTGAKARCGTAHL